MLGNETLDCAKEESTLKVSAEEKKAEAVMRMKSLRIFPETINQFEKGNLVSISEPPFGAFYWAEGEDLEKIRKFEAEYDVLVYVVVRSYTTIGKLDSYLYVSGDRDEWELERGDVSAWEPIAYVYNHDCPDCSEFGRIALRPTIGAGLYRTI